MLFSQPSSKGSASSAAGGKAAGGMTGSIKIEVNGAMSTASAARSSKSSSGGNSEDSANGKSGGGGAGSAASGWKALSDNYLMDAVRELPSFACA